MLKFDTTQFQYYAIDFKFTRGKLLIKPEGSAKRFFNAESKKGQLLINDMTNNNPELLFAAPAGPTPQEEKFQAAVEEAKMVPLRLPEEKMDFQFHPIGLGGRQYFVNNADINSSDAETLKDVIKARLVHSGMGPGTDVVVNLLFANEKDGKMYYTQKTFTSFKLGEFGEFMRKYREWASTTIQSESDDYTLNIDRVKITLIRENAGGCNSAGKAKHKRIGEFIHHNERSKNNNCLFACIWDEIKHEGKRLITQAACNGIRRVYGVEDNATIPISVALRILKDDRKNPEDEYEIVDADAKQIYRTCEGEGKRIKKRLGLSNSHYVWLEESPKKKCVACLRQYYGEHKCNSTRVNYASHKIKHDGKRFLITKTYTEKSNNSEGNKNQTRVIHYDLETFQDRKSIQDHIAQTPCIVGYVDTDGFQTITGDNCIGQFVDVLIAKLALMKQTPEEKRVAIAAAEAGKKHVQQPRVLYLNAFNGSNFDHYSVFKEFHRRGVKIDKYIVNNGAIITFQYTHPTSRAVLKFFDIAKHLLGPLKSNLKDLGCKVQKGEFDYRRLKRWEEMDEKAREDCIVYLQSDVLGLKELYDKINKTIFEEHTVNITSYVSTSSLSFNLWKRAISGKHVVMLPTIEQETAFRAAVKGGRCYKSKHRFVSEDYKKFKAGKIPLSEVKDYLIDADVVSLYPAAMAQYEYPVGDWLTWDKKKSGGKRMGAAGIYKVKYIANKNIPHAILGRREKVSGAISLKWDLKDGVEWVTSVDMDLAEENGYILEIQEGYYVEKTEPVFKEYIEEMFKKKSEAKKGTPSYMLAKLFMNGLYGKNIQRPITCITKTIKTNADYWKFWGEHVVKDLVKLDTAADGTESWAITGELRNDIMREKAITKPTHYGAFILAYSRKIMLKYIKEANPYFLTGTTEQKVENDIYYTDTDSLQIHARNAKNIKNLGKKHLGGITDDLGDGCKIMRGIWVAPKLYMLEYYKEGEIDEKGLPIPHFHFRGKGLNKNKLTVEQYESMDKGNSMKNVRDFQMKKINHKRNSKQLHVPNYTILYKENISRTVNKTAWAGRNFEGNASLPWNYSDK